METTNINMNAAGVQSEPQTIYVVKKSNDYGVAGFILALVSVLFSWTPIISWILLISAFVLSKKGTSGNHRGLAIVGAILSGLVIVVKIIINLVFVGALSSIALF